MGGPQADRQVRRVLRLEQTSFRRCRAARVAEGLEVLPRLPVHTRQRRIVLDQNEVERRGEGQVNKRPILWVNDACQTPSTPPPDCRLPSFGRNLGQVVRQGADGLFQATFV
jgi:hypothetical protein